MKKYQNTFLAGVAALALVAGTGFASAQYQSKDHHAAMQGKGPQASTQTMKKGKGGMAGGQAQLKGKMHQNGQTANKGTEQNAKGTKGMGPSTAQKGAGTAEKGKQAQKLSRGRKGNKENRTVQGQPQHKGGATAQQQPSKKGASTAQEQRRHGRASTAQRQEERNGLKGLQGNAAKPMQGAQGGPQGTAGAQRAEGTNVSLSERQRTEIRRTIIEARRAPKVGHVDFDVRVGTVIPRQRIHIIPVPRTLVRIEPRWRHFLYFIYEDEVVIVNPRDMRIVAVLPV
jgi:Protein of unknown function (DUF1236)